MKATLSFNGGEGGKQDLGFLEGDYYNAKQHMVIGSGFPADASNVTDGGAFRVVAINSAGVTVEPLAGGEQRTMAVGETVELVSAGPVTLVAVSE